MVDVALSAGAKITPIVAASVGVSLIEFVSTKLVRFGVLPMRCEESFANGFANEPRSTAWHGTPQARIIA